MAIMMKKPTFDRSDDPDVNAKNAEAAADYASTAVEVQKQDTQAKIQEKKALISKALDDAETDANGVTNGTVS